MSYEGSTTKTNKMLDSLNLQLREAEKRRADAERAHQVKPNPVLLSHIIMKVYIVDCDSAGVPVLRGQSTFVPASTDSFETNQSARCIGCIHEFPPFLLFKYEFISIIK